MNNTVDKIAALTKEAENLKLKLEEERQKLNDVACKFWIVFFFSFYVRDPVHLAFQHYM